MKLFTSLVCTLALVSACQVTSNAPPANSKPQPAVKKEQPVALRNRQSALAGYSRVGKRITPAATRLCRVKNPTAPAKFCQFRFDLVDDPKQPPNAYQGIGKDGRPVVAFNINMLRSIRNDHEIAFILGHEFGHQIARHLVQRRNNANAGAILGAILIGAIGGNPQDGVNIGGTIGSRVYSKQHELQADIIGTHIADRTGYDPSIGARSFNRISGGSDNLLSTHPPSADRIATVRRTIAQIAAAKRAGQTPQVVW